MPEPREVRPVSFGSPKENMIDFRPVNRAQEDTTEEVKTEAPKSPVTSLSAPHVQERLLSDGDEKKKSQTPSSETSTVEVTQENSSASDAKSNESAKSTDVPSESSTDSGQGEAKQTEETSSSKSQLPTKPIPPAPIGKK